MKLQYAELYNIHMFKLCIKYVCLQYGYIIWNYIYYSKYMYENLKCIDQQYNIITI